jgi:hypothetical protein
MKGFRQDKGRKGNGEDKKKRGKNKKKSHLRDKVKADAANHLHKCIGIFDTALDLREKK